MKTRFMNALQRWHFLARPLYWAAALCVIATMVWPIIQTNLDTLYWLSALTGCAFLLSSAAILDISHQHRQTRSGIKGWFLQLWNRFMFWLWLLASISLLVFLIKIITYMQTH